MRPMPFLLALLVATSAFATPPFSTVLLPVFTVPAAGAHGSLWVSEVVLHNPLATDVDLIVCTDECRVMKVPPGTHTHLLDGYRSTAARPGLLLGRYNDVPSIALRVRDVSRNGKSLGIELPAVTRQTSGAFRMFLLNVPLESQFRYKLRMYATNDGEANLHVRMIVEETGEVLGEPDVKLSASYAELDPIPESVAAARAGQHVRIEITRRDAFLMNDHWAFMTVTNNDTQEVTAVTPQYAP